MTSAVLADAQFSVARVFRPFLGFEAVYQGQPIERPIAIPGNLDPEAGRTGFDPNLLSAISVPFGAKMVLWIPTIFYGTEGGLRIQPYKYSIVWRVRNLRDFRSNRAAYHFARQSPGEDDQFVIPSAVQGIMYEGYPRTISDPVYSEFRTRRSALHEYVLEEVEFKSSIPTPPLTPAAQDGAFQQGLAEAGVGSNNTVTFNQVQFDVMGDEFMLLVNRPVLEGTDGEIWDFTQSDRDAGFSRFYGTANGTRRPIRDMGIYVFTGSNP